MTASVTYARSVVPATGDRRRLAARWLATVAAAAGFVTAIPLISTGLHDLGPQSVPWLPGLVADPIGGLALGLLATALAGNSTAVVAITVAVLASGMVELDGAIAVVMGTALGATLPGVLAALGFADRPTELRRALTTAVALGLQQVLTLGIAAPVEFLFHPLETGSAAITDALSALTVAGGTSTCSGTPAAIAVAVAHGAGTMSHSWPVAVADVLFGVVLCIVAIRVAGHFLEIFMVGRSRALLTSTADSRPAAAIGVGTGITVLTQSTTLTNVMLVRFAGTGAILPTQVWWVALGTNLGTVPTAFAAALATGADATSPAVQLGVAHLLFAAATIALMAGTSAVRRLVQHLASGLAEAIVERRSLPIS